MFPYIETILFKLKLPSGGKDFHPTALTEPYPDKKSGQAVNLSVHTALHIQSQMYYTFWMY